MPFELKRRNFVRALGLGAAGSILAPVLQSAVASANGSVPCRFVIFVEGNGLEPKAVHTTPIANAVVGMSSMGGNRDYTHEAPIVVPDADLSSARALVSLAEAGIVNKSALVLGLSNQDAGGGHSSGHGALSCARQNGGIPQAMSIDHHLGQLPAVRREAPFDVIRLGMGGGRLNYGLCAFDKAKPAPVIHDPTLAFNTLFGSVASGAGQEMFRTRGELLDIGRDDTTKALAAFSGNSRERAKLEAYLTSLEEMVVRRQKLEAMGAQLQAVKPVEPTDEPLYASTAPYDRLLVHTDMVAASLIGGLTNCAVVSCGGGNAWELTYPTLSALYPGGDLVRGHTVRHSAAGQDPATGYHYLLHEVSKRNIDEMARLARALNAVGEPNGNGTMLDHTVMLYMPDNGEKHHSGCEEWAALVIGGGALGFNTDGRSIVYPRIGREQHREVENLFCTLAHAAGDELQGFGTGQNRYAEGPLAELWQAV